MQPCRQRSEIRLGAPTYIETPSPREMGSPTDAAHAAPPESEPRRRLLVEAKPFAIRAKRGPS
jgi:hypothetical protein